MEITYSAPICAVLSGGLSALYGKPVLAIAMGMRLTFSLKESSSKHFDPVVKGIEEKVQNYLTVHGIRWERKSYTYSIECDYPMKNSQEYTAALYVCAVAAFLFFYTGKEYELSTVNSLAFELEKEKDHISLGYATSVSSYGGVQYFRKEFEFLKSISLLSFKFPVSFVQDLYIVPFSESFTTTQNKIKNRYNQNPVQMEAIFSQLEKDTKRLVVAISKEDKKMFRESLDHHNSVIAKEFPEINCDFFKYEEDGHKETFFPFTFSESGLLRT